SFGSIGRHCRQLTATDSERPPSPLVDGRGRGRNAVVTVFHTLERVSSLPDHFSLFLVGRALTDTERLGYNHICNGRPPDVNRRGVIRRSAHPSTSINPPLYVNQPTPPRQPTHPSTSITPRSRNPTFGRAQVPSRRLVRRLVGRPHGRFREARSIQRRCCMNQLYQAVCPGWRVWFAGLLTLFLTLGGEAPARGGFIIASIGQNKQKKGGVGGLNLLSTGNRSAYNTGT